ncbi:MAG: tetratricopeptide repeat protein [Bacteroides sp.]|nr:tetratricopeptide repeat protein [Bacteroides sp.]MCM1413553.1 tetratricopeptide repeat protein [Bacteroides sp.]MCM1471107.1 tetratricopeptide repeat protein [Bacteroides sp.]
MLKIRRLFILLLFAAMVVPAMAQSDMAVRAARFFQYREWNSAGALYTMLIADEPDNKEYYSRAIVSAGMIGDTLQQSTLTHAALNAHIPVDSIFSAVERTSFSIGQTSLYEQYLLQTKAENPWMTRIIDACLMRYYTYRRNPEGMIAYSTIMLRGNPDDERFLYTLAQGYLYDGQTDRALDTYRHILSLNPQSVDALLYLANYYAQTATGDKAARQQALDYFRRASNIISTPYIDDQIRRLSRISQ